MGGVGGGALKKSEKGSLSADVDVEEGVLLNGTTDWLAAY